MKNSLPNDQHWFRFQHSLDTNNVIFQTDV